VQFVGHCSRGRQRVEDRQDVERRELGEHRTSAAQYRERVEDCQDVR